MTNPHDPFGNRPGVSPSRPGIYLQAGSQSSPHCCDHAGKVIRIKPCAYTDLHTGNFDLDRPNISNSIPTIITLYNRRM